MIVVELVSSIDHIYNKICNNQSFNSFLGNRIFHKREFNTRIQHEEISKAEGKNINRRIQEKLGQTK